MHAALSAAVNPKPCFALNPTPAQSMRAPVVALVLGLVLDVAAANEGPCHWHRDAGCTFSDSYAAPVLLSSSGADRPIDE